MFLVAQKILKIVIESKVTIVKFSSRRKSSEVLRKKKKLKNIDGSKFDFNAGVKLYINESLCPYYRGLWRIKLFSHFTQLTAFCIKRSEWDSTISVTHDEDLWQFQKAV